LYARQTQHLQPGLHSKHKIAVPRPTIPAHQSQAVQKAFFVLVIIIIDPDHCWDAIDWWTAGVSQSNGCPTPIVAAVRGHPQREPTVHAGSRRYPTALGVPCPEWSMQLSHTGMHQEQCVFVVACHRAHQSIRFELVLHLLMLAGQTQLALQHPFVRLVVQMNLCGGQQ
jgi:hypothetical protein